MELFLKWLALAGVQTAATMSPGPAFVVAVRNAMTYGRKAGIFTAIGLGCGVGVHVAFVLFGIAYILTKSVLLYTIVKYAGAAYLVFIGIKALKSKKAEPADPANEQTAGKPAKTISSYKAFLIGFMTNVLNPKAVVFFTAVYAQFIDPAMSWQIHALYGITSVTIEILWFSGVAIVLTNPAVKRKFDKIVHWIERSCGALMIALGAKLALSAK
ncbi:MAG: LysE family translocator [Alphaproteobacteria bacterium]|nr:LysE family translocator [Alphaproteobacteria bacterium]